MTRSSSSLLTRLCTIDIGIDEELERQFDKTFDIRDKAVINGES